MANDFYGLPTRALENSLLRLEYLVTAGPRLVRLFLAGSDENLLAEVPGMHWETPYGEFHIWGGHRLWHAPEAHPRSYMPDNDPVQVDELPGGVYLTQPVEPGTGIQKRMEIRLAPDQPGLTIVHSLKNTGLWPVELAPWAITQLPLGGVAVLPQPVGPLDTGGLLPNRQLALWPYTRFQDPRLHLDDDLITVQGQPQLPPLKIGQLNHAGWAGYLRHGVFLRKRFAPQDGLPHPDLGCNVEVYCNDVCLELETVAPLARLGPGETATHVEHWDLIAGCGQPEDLDALRRVVAELVSI